MIVLFLCLVVTLCVIAWLSRSYPTNPAPTDRSGATKLQNRVDVTPILENQRKDPE